MFIFFTFIKTDALPTPPIPPSTSTMKTQLRFLFT